MSVRVALALLVAAGAALAVAATAPEPVASPSPAPAASPDWPVTFVDVAEKAGLRQASVYGGLERKRFIIETNGAGVAFFDYDDDGWVDALVLNGTRLAEGARQDAVWPKGEAPTNRLYRNDRDGTFTDVTGPAGLRRTAWSSSVCVGDYDNDARLDLFLTAFGKNALYRNRGGGRFEDVTGRAGLATSGTRWGSGCSFFDYDRDGRADLFVANYLSFDLATAAEPGKGPNCVWKGVPVNCGPKGLPTDTNLLYHNEGDGTFRDVSQASGVARVTGRYAMTASATDFDGDGWLDVYVACDSTAAILYRNNRDGTFTDVAMTSGTAYNEYGGPQAGMGLGVGDFDGDGRLDLLKTHFADDIPALYRNLGGGLFEDLAVPAGLGAINRHVEWGGGLADLDNDGLQDIVYVTGNVYPEIERTMPHYPHRGPRIVFRNGGAGRFEDVSARSGPGATAPHSSRGAAFGDFDNDGEAGARGAAHGRPLAPRRALVRHALRPARRYSTRSATAGSIRRARRAGAQLASRAYRAPRPLHEVTARWSTRLRAGDAARIAGWLYRHGVLEDAHGQPSLDGARAQRLSSRPICSDRHAVP